MSADEPEAVYLLTAAPAVRTGPDGRPVHVRGRPDAPSIAAVPMETFKAGMAGFMGSVRAVVGDIEAKAGGYEVHQLEIAASIGADGKVSFLGSGMGVETAASFTLTLRKRGAD